MQTDIATIGMRRISLMIALALALPCGAALADVKPPRPAPAKPIDQDKAVPLAVKLQGEGGSVVLEVPTSMLRSAGSTKPQAANEGDSQAQVASGGGSAMRSVVAGVMLSLAFAAGGLWLARRKTRGAAMSVALFIAVAGGAAMIAADAMANKAVPPPPPAEPKPPIIAPANDLTVRLVPVAENGRITLVLSEKQLEAIAKQIGQQRKPTANEK